MGDKKSPVKKYTLCAALVTAAVLVLVLAVLIISSIVFAVSDGGNSDIGGSASSGGDGGGSVSTAQTVTVDEATLKGKVSITDTDIQKNRSKNGDDTKKYYYAMSGDTLKSDAFTAMDTMLVEFFKQSQKPVFVGGAKQISDKTGYVVEIRNDGDSFSAAKAISETDTTYKWIFDNAYKYGFVYDKNTFTYVGVAAATYMRNNSKTVTSLDVFANTVKSKAVSVSVMGAGATKATSYQIYYLAVGGGELQLPANYGYTVIPHGTSGYIVTVDTSSKIASTSNTTGGVG